MNKKPVVTIFSNANFLALYLLENLLSKDCYVFVFSPDPKSWIEKTTHITNKNNFQVTDEENFSSNIPTTYAIFFSGFLGEKDIYEKFKSLYSLSNFKDIKSLALFPSEVFNSQENDALPLNNNLSVIYTGDLLGPRIDIQSNLIMSKIIREVIEERFMVVGVGQVFYPVFAADIARQISKWIFSFGPYGKETFVLGAETSASGLWKEITKLIPGVRLYYDKNIKTGTLPRSIIKEIIVSNLPFSLRETFRGVVLQKPQPKSLVKKGKGIPKKIKILSTIILTLLFTPLLSLILSSFLLFSSYKIFLFGKTEIARSLLSFAKTTSVVGGSISFIPELNYGLTLTKQISEFGLNLLPVVSSSREIFGNILGGETYNMDELFSNLKVNMDNIYATISLIEVDTSEASDRGIILARKFKQEFDFEKTKRLVAQGSNATSGLPEVLGKDGRQTYLILFQNNMELRPTGGFIGSFAIVTLERGKMVDFSVSDVYSADGQLRGHVEPPLPIKKYLGEANWFLRDSNWDPDFPTSAKRAEWFIDKEIDQSVNGVIGIDLRLVKDILKITGPIFLADYNMDITYDNLYEKTQEEVEKDFFPGTHKKASFLTTLSRNLVSILGELSDRQKLGILKLLFENFEQRHIQAYVHNDETQGPISTLGWAGEVDSPQCMENCYSDFVGLVEANVGVNKANYFISRDQKLAITRENGRITRDLTIKYKNSADPGLGLIGDYKTYIRVLVPGDTVIEGDYEITESRGFKEIGFLLEVLSGQEQEIVVSWSSEASQNPYTVFVRKQAGVDEDGHLQVVIDGEVVYNSNLTRDIWIK